MNYSEIVNRLVGKINPIGETNTDNERFENLKSMCELVNDLVTQIDSVITNNKDSYEASRKRAAEYADLFLTQTLGVTP